MFTFLHGFTGSPAVWDPVIAHENVPVFRPFLVGHGPDPVYVSSWKEEITRIALLMRQKSSKHRLIGYSFGARVALGVAIEFPELITSLVLIGVNPGIKTEKERFLREKWENQWLLPLQNEELSPFLTKWTELSLFKSQKTLSKRILLRQENIRFSHSPTGLACAMQVCGLGNMPYYTNLISSLPMPVHFIVGEKDPKFRNILNTIQMNEQSTKTIVDLVGHNVVLEAPEVLSKLVFLEY